MIKAPHNRNLAREASDAKLHHFVSLPVTNSLLRRHISDSVMFTGLQMPCIAFTLME